MQEQKKGLTLYIPLSLRNVIKQPETWEQLEKTFPEPVVAWLKHISYYNWNLMGCWWYTLIENEKISYHSSSFLPPWLLQFIALRESTYFAPWQPLRPFKWWTHKAKSAPPKPKLTKGCWFLMLQQQSLNASPAPLIFFSVWEFGSEAEHIFSLIYLSHSVWHTGWRWWNNLGGWTDK